MGAVKRLDLALFIDTQHQRAIWRVHFETDDVGDFVLEVGIVRDLEPTHEMRLQARFSPDPLHAGVADAMAFAMERTLQCVAFGGVSVAVFASTWCLTDTDSGAVPAGRVLSCNNPSTPASMYRSCQRHTHGLDLPVRFKIAFVPSPSAVARSILARHTALLELLRSEMIASSFARFVGPTKMQMSFHLISTV